MNDTHTGGEGLGALGAMTEPGDEAQAGAGDALGLGGGEIAEPKRGVPTHIIILVVILGAAGAGLTLMRMKGMGPAEASAAPRIDYDIAAGADPITEEHKAVLRDLNASGEVVQVPEDQVQKNPFELPEAGVALPLFNEGDMRKAEALARARAEAERKAREREREVESALAMLTVQSIMEGRSPIARISGQTVKVGSTVADIFVVKRIGGGIVELSADGQSYTLTMPAAGSKSNGRRRP